jgi:hypothetical protein
MLTWILAWILAWISENWFYIATGGFLALTFTAIKEKERQGGKIYSHLWDDIVESPVPATLGYITWFVVSGLLFVLLLKLFQFCLRKETLDAVLEILRIVFLRIDELINLIPNVPFLILVIVALLLFFKKMNQTK